MEAQFKDQMLLIELIDRLERCKDKDKPLYLDIGDKRPYGLTSYRGRYEDLCITTEEQGCYKIEISVDTDSNIRGEVQKRIGKKHPTVNEFIDVLKESIWKVFIGYKAGEFRMSKYTPLWIAEYGESKLYVPEIETMCIVYPVDVYEDDELDKTFIVTNKVIEGTYKRVKIEGHDI